MYVITFYYLTLKVDVPATMRLPPLVPPVLLVTVAGAACVTELDRGHMLRRRCEGRPIGGPGPARSEACSCHGGPRCYVVGSLEHPTNHDHRNPSPLEWAGH